MRVIALTTKVCPSIKQVERTIFNRRPFLQQFLPAQVRLQAASPFRPCLPRAISTASSPAPAMNSSTNGVTAAPDRKVYINYHIYKGKSALCLRPVKPTFKQLDAGGLTLHKEGALFLEFAQAVGAREYDWANKKIFALSVAELGSILAMSATDQTEFFHDPNKGRAGEGMVTKTLRISPMKDGLFFSISIREQGREDKVSVPVSRSEFVVIRNTMNYVMPHLMGWHAFVDPSIIDSTMIDGNPSNVQNNGPHASADH